MYKQITSAQNPQVKQLVKLKKRGERDETQLFLIEGYRELTRALHAHVPLEALFFSRELFLGSNEMSLIKKYQDARADICELPKSIFEKISYRDRPDGLIGIARQIHRTLSELPMGNGFFVVVEAIEKPGNLGSMLRSSDAAGVDGMIVCDPCTDIYNPNVVRSSVGTLFTVPTIETTSESAMAWLKERGIHIVATTPYAEKEYTKVDLSGPVAIVMGTEQLGLSQKWLDRADITVKIPMYGVADSLNVAAAATLLLYEVRRQR